MNQIPVTRYFRDTRMIRYAMIPTEVLKMDLSSTAVLVYILLLHRATGSQKNGLCDEGGWIYVIYPIRELAEDLGVKSKIIQKHLLSLEEAGLILRKRPVGNRASHIFLNIPVTSDCTVSEGEKLPAGENKTACSIPKKGPAIEQYNKTIIPTLYYRHTEEESL